jgi:hypothetical protein
MTFCVYQFLEKICSQFTKDFQCILKEDFVKKEFAERKIIKSDSSSKENISMLCKLIKVQIDNTNEGLNKAK